MDEALDLIRPSRSLRLEYADFYQEWRESGERMTPWVIRKDPSDFEGMLQFLLDQETTVSDGGVPSSTYWLVTQDRRVVGASNLRHHLDDRLQRCGGHIGYGSRPSERRKGYATMILALTLEKAQLLDLTRVLLCCDAGNVGSGQTIRRNAGIPDQTGIDDAGSTVLRFWIHIGCPSPRGRGGAENTVNRSRGAAFALSEMRSSPVKVSGTSRCRMEPIFP